MNVEDLKIDLANIRKKNLQLYQEKIMPELQIKAGEFLDTFEDYFRERGFVVKKDHHSVRVAFDSLEFTAFSNDSNDIFIMKEREQIASISIKYKRTKVDTQVTLDSFEQITKEIEREKTLSNDLEHPIFYYTGSEFGYQYDTPLSVLDSIFHV